MSDIDWSIRLAAFKALEALVVRHGPALHWSEIAKGFEFQGSTILFANRARGIFRPKQMQGPALSIKSTTPREGRERRYEDLATDDGFIYRFQGVDPEAWDNLALHQAHDKGLPLIYFFGIAPAVYRPIWPVFIADFDPMGLSCKVMADQSDRLREPGRFVADGNSVAIERRYSTVEVKKRLHQEAFRYHVLEAYGDRCAVCRFPRRELIEAAHILPDRDERGVAEVPNGLALCKLHHGVFDANLMGIRPTGVIEIAPSLLAEKDGPTLEFGIKGFQGKTLHLPSRPEAHPGRPYLEERYAQFLRAAC